MKIVAIADLHYREEPVPGAGDGHLADLLLERAVHRINRMIRPDIVVLLGDLLDDGAGPAAPALRRRLADIVETIVAPTLALPGNHDGDPELFYREFPRPPDNWLDIAGVRLLTFLDAEAPGWCAQRSAADLERMAAARAGFSGPVVALQHTSLFPAGRHECPYNLVNGAAVIRRMRDAGIGLSVSGHYHAGIEPIRTDTAAFVGAPALCETPFAFLEIEVEGERVAVKRHVLRMDPNLALVDTHTHTPFAYCSSNMDLQRSVSLARLFGLEQVAFTEHSGHLYFGKKDYWSFRCLDLGLDAIRPENDRMAVYLAQARAANPGAPLGLEADCDRAGRPLVRARDRAQVDYLVGAMHFLPALRENPGNQEMAADQFMAMLSNFAASGIAVLAHPFRVFRRAGVPVPESLLAPTVALLKNNGVAAEINFHVNEPDPAFFASCMEAGVRVSFASDAHALWEVGEFGLHLSFLAACGWSGDPAPVLWRPPKKQIKQASLPAASRAIAGACAAIDTGVHHEQQD